MIGLIENGRERLRRLYPTLRHLDPPLSRFHFLRSVEQIVYENATSSSPFLEKEEHKAMRAVFSEYRSVADERKGP